MQVHNIRKLLKEAYRGLDSFYLLPYFLCKQIVIKFQKGEIFIGESTPLCTVFTQNRAMGYIKTISVFPASTTGIKLWGKTNKLSKFYFIVIRLREQVWPDSEELFSIVCNIFKSKEYTFLFTSLSGIKHRVSSMISETFRK